MIKKTRWVIEQSVGTLKHLFLFTKAKYFSIEKVLTQAYLKVICVNLLKASNKISCDF
ncbi:MAG: transposase [Endozoicomonadaceae bacterium]|nr:transposase [Endozoicomonadaceae bacterium]